MKLVAEQGRGQVGYAPRGGPWERINTIFAVITERNAFKAGI